MPGRTVRPGEQHVLPGQVTGVRAAQERADRAEFVGRAETPGRHVAALRFTRRFVVRPFCLRGRFGRLLQTVGIEQPRQQVVDRHVARRDALLPRDARDEAGQPRAGAVRQAEHVDRRFHGARRDVDDAPEAALGHPVDGRLDQLDRRQHVRVERRDPVVARPFAEIARRRAARVVHEDVDLRRGRERRRAARARRDVAGQGHHRDGRVERAQFAGGRVERVAAARGDHDVHALGDERLRAPLAQPLAGRANQRPAAFDVQIHVCFAPGIQRVSSGCDRNRHGNKFKL